jgi:hypothetical protein
MQTVATIGFLDTESRDEANAIVRAAPGEVALALTLRASGDLEVVMAPETSNELVAALSEAVRVAEQNAKPSE